jgi:hypothetical protein
MFPAVMGSPRDWSFDEGVAVEEFTPARRYVDRYNDEPTFLRRLKWSRKLLAVAIMDFTHVEEHVRCL